MAESFPVHGPPFQLRLSRWDQRFPAMYSKRLLCFSLPDNSPEYRQFITRLLLEALRATVQEIPFLAGSVIPFSKSQPWLRDLQPSGAACLETRDLTSEFSFTKLSESSFASSLLDATKLCPFPAPAYIQDDPVDVCRIRANFIDGGLILVIQIIHTVCDGRGISDVLQIFAANLVKAQEAKSTSSGISLNDDEGKQKEYVLDRTTLLSGQGIHGDIENHSCWTTAPFLPPSRPSNPVPTICANFQISIEALQALKKAACPPISSTTTDNARPPTKASTPSTHDAIAALIWRSLILARYRAEILSSSSTVQFATAIDCRRHLGLPKPYLGNAIYGIKISLALRELAMCDDRTPASSNKGLQIAASMLREKINSTTGDDFRDLLGFVERTDSEMPTRLAVFEDLAIGTVMVVSYFGFDMHGLDFGEAFGGRIKAFRLPSSGLLPGMPVVLPRLSDGSCEFVLNERADVMAYIAKDEVFQAFVRKQH